MAHMAGDPVPIGKEARLPPPHTNSIPNQRAPLHFTQGRERRGCCAGEDSSSLRSVHLEFRSIYRYAVRIALDITRILYFIIKSTMLIGGVLHTAVWGSCLSYRRRSKHCPELSEDELSKDLGDRNSRHNEHVSPQLKKLGELRLWVCPIRLFIKE